MGSRKWGLTRVRPHLRDPIYVGPSPTPYSPLWRRRDDRGGAADGEHARPGDAAQTEQQLRRVRVERGPRAPVVAEQDASFASRVDVGGPRPPDRAERFRRRAGERVPP